MAQVHELTLKASLFASKKKLVIQPTYIQFEQINFSKSSITEVRFGVKSIEGYRFIIGRTYCIDIKNLKDEIIKIRLTSIYRIRKKLLGEKYATIINAIFENYFEDLINNFIKSFFDKASFILLGNTFTQEGIILEKSTEVITWPDLGTRDFWNYFLIYSVSKPDRYRTFYYLTDFNTIVLRSVSRYILESKGYL